jgi:hypothetical protein
MNEDEKVVVYGSFNDEDIRFLSLDTAAYYANFHTAYKKGMTFEEFFERFPDILELVMEHRANQLDHSISVPLTRGRSAEEYFDCLFDEFYDDYSIRSEWEEMADDEYDFEERAEARKFYKNVLEGHQRLPLQQEIFDSSSIDPFDLLELLGYRPTKKDIGVAS